MTLYLLASIGLIIFFSWMLMLVLGPSLVLTIAGLVIVLTATVIGLPKLTRGKPGSDARH